MIVVTETRQAERAAAAIGEFRSSPDPLPHSARLAVEAAAAVQRGELDVEQASRRYGAPTALIEVWQRALANAGLAGARFGRARCAA